MLTFSYSFNDLLLVWSQISNAKILSLMSNIFFLLQVWMDGRISSIERKPHESGCSCQFYVNFYTNQGSLGSVRETLSKEITAIGIDRISILQKLSMNSCEDQHYRWEFSEDCPSRQKTKLLLGKILTDLSWLLVTSSLKRVSFDVRSVQNKIAYQILQGGEEGTSSSNLHAVNFRVDNSVSVPIVVEFALDDQHTLDPKCDTDEAGPSSFSDATGLRRSKRRNVQPERFLGCDSGSEIDIGYVRTRPYKIDRGEDDELNMPLACLFGPKKMAICAEAHTDKFKKRGRPRKIDSFVNRSTSETTSAKVKSSGTKRKEDQSQLAIVPFAEKSDPLAFQYYQFQGKNPPNREKEFDEISPQRFYVNSGSSRGKKKRGYDSDDFDLETTWETARSYSKRPVQKKRYHYVRFKNSSGERIYQKRSLSAGAYTELINTYLQNIDCTGNEEPPITEQWKENKKRVDNVGLSSNTEVPPEDEEEMSETEMLWKEMELALASIYVLDDNEVKLLVLLFP